MTYKWLGEWNAHERGKNSKKQEVRGRGGMSLKIRKGNKEIWNGIRKKNC